MAPSPKIELAPFYYRDNFLRLCETVESQYGDMLSPAERDFLDRFNSLSNPAQCLYVRLVSRVGPWFRTQRLNYPELGDCAPWLDELKACDLLEPALELNAGDLGALYTRRELSAMLETHVELRGVTDKASLLLAIESAKLGPAALCALATRFSAEEIVSPLGSEQVDCLQILFFGNRHQTLTEFVLSDLGVSRYFPYALDRSDRRFSCREAFEEYRECGQLSDRWYQWRDEEGSLEALRDLGGEILGKKVRYASSRSRWSRLCNRLAREFERLGDLDLSLALYRVSERHPCRERSARVLERQGELKAARVLCESIREEPWCEEEYDAAGRILSRLLRTLEGVRQVRVQEDYRSTVMRLSRGAQSVELTVAASLEKEWGEVHYVENKLMNALFGLAFWEQIFLPVKGAFNHPFQAVPSDMYERGFRSQREQPLESRMRQLESSDPARELVSSYERYQGYQCHWVDWRRIGIELVEKAALVIPREHLLGIWQRMLFDPRENRRGFPDLIALGSAPGDYCLIEVKAPGDALQESQKRWLRFFQQCEIPAQVAWVEWQDG